MKQKSASLGGLPSIQIPTHKVSHLNYHSRLQFPIIGDSRFYSNSGRKHYQNHSDRVLKIILPRAYPLREPIHQNSFVRQNSLPPPHLQTQIAASHVENKTLQPKTTKASNLYGKIEDQLDKMKAQIQREKMSLFISKKFQKTSDEHSPSQQRNQVKSRPTAIPSQTIAPASESKRQKSIGYFLQPIREVRQLRMSINQNPRARNPSFLSSGLAII